MGGGVDHGLKTQQIQQVQEHVEVDDENGTAHEIVHNIGDYTGWWPLLFIILLGSKKIRTKGMKMIKAFME